MKKSASKKRGVVVKGQSGAIQFGLSDGPGESMTLTCGAGRITLAMDAENCAGLAAWFAQAAERRDKAAAKSAAPPKRPAAGRGRRGG